MKRHEIVDLISSCIREANPKGLNLNNSIMTIEPDLFDIDINKILGFKLFTGNYGSYIRILFPYEATEEEVIFAERFRRLIEDAPNI